MKQAHSNLVAVDEDVPPKVVSPMVYFFNDIIALLYQILHITTRFSKRAYSTQRDSEGGSSTNSIFLENVYLREQNVKMHQIIQVRVQCNAVLRYGSNSYGKKRFKLILEFKFSRYASKHNSFQHMLS